ncbi:signal peptide-containing protein [Theileria equi strain WA]|uniref:Signal peptide-containing protein n=1 Tax=Theileria equi strain WA TaxID=1537102 RepID=L0B0G5_THEEQ|nr:signal peptide-containing protein [Theileria equi strain WA]AFZ80629.1 signal peptide-containing protein [Theileria equi strain WA]|eukprot:XP_004830295.1 signal peptide-containing protein [Theileria equi strain WA]
MRALVESILLLFCLFLGCKSVSGDKDDPIPLDINSRNQSGVDVTEGFLKDIKYTTYRPIESAGFSSVSDGIHRLWTASSDDQCRFSRLISKGSENPLLFLHVLRSGLPAHKHFEKGDNSWRPISENDFFKKQDELYTGKWVKVVLNKPKGPKTKYLEDLDIVKTDLSRFSLSAKEDAGVEYKKFIVKDDVSISSVVDDEAKVWDIPSDIECRRVNLYKKGDEILLAIEINAVEDDFKYYEKKSGILWSSISSQEFELELERFQTGICRTCELTKEPYVLDFSNINDKKVHKIAYNYSGFNQTQYTVLGKLKIDSIVDGASEIWKAKKGEECLTVVLSASDEFHLLSVRTTLGKDPSVLRFEKEYGRWSKISEKVYLRKLYGSSFDEVLDITKVTPDNAYLTYKMDDGFPYKQFVPKDELFSQVVEGETIIWETKYNRLCRHLDLYSRDDFKILRLETKIYSSIEEDYYKKTDGKWQTIDENEYLEGIKNIKDNTYRIPTSGDGNIVVKEYSPIEESAGFDEEGLLMEFDFGTEESGGICPADDNFLNNPESYYNDDYLRGNRVGYSSFWGWFR